jgi:transcriptional regulator with GAF, ATPase, and Fis domain
MYPVIGHVWEYGWRKVEAVPALLRQPVARRRLVLFLAALFVCANAVAVLGYVLVTPDIGVRCAFSRVVNDFSPTFLEPNDQDPIQVGDTIVQLGDHPVENWPQLLRRLLELRNEPAEPGDPHEESGDHPRRTLLRYGDQRLVLVQYERPEPTGEVRRHKVWCRLGRPPLETLLPSILYFFLKIGLFTVGAIVFWQRPEDRSAAQFFVLCIVSLGAYIGGYHWSRIVTQPVLLVVFMVCAILLPAVSLHFYLVFPRPKGFLERHPRRTLAALYGLPLAFLVLLLSNYLRVRWLYRRGMAEGVPGDVGPLLDEMLLEIYVYFGVAAVWYLASVVCLVHSYRTAANGTEQNQVKWILFGALAALVPIGYSLYLAFLEQTRFGGGAATWPMFAASVCVTAAFTVSITRYRLMQLDQLISSGMVYFVISSLAGAVYYGVVFAGVLLVGSRGMAGPSLGEALGASTTALVLMLVLDLIRGRLQAALARHFRREKHQLDRTLRRLSQAIEQLVDPPTLARHLLQTSAELLGAGGGAVYLRQGEPPLYRLAGALGAAPPLNELSSGCPLVEAVRANGTLLPKAHGPAADPAQRQMQFLGGAVAHALAHEGQLLGLLVLGRKEGSAYVAEDLNLLAAFAQLTVLALVSAEGHRTIEALNRDLRAKVEKIAEQQRRILALQSQLNSGVREDRRARSAGDGPSSPAHPAPDAELPEGMVGSGPQVRQLMHLVRKVAASQSAVLLRGESGTGKELLARALHENSPRAGKAFVKVNCAALSPGLLESELFGHVKGAFTSAIRDKVGRFEAADGGTLFLDEIGDVSLEVQTKLLRVLQEMTFERVGSSESVRVDVRVVAATHQDLEGLIAQGRFREDLFYRLNVFPIRVPPLRERAEDVPELAEHFLRLYAQRAGKGVPQLDDDALALLKAYPWPGNVRQLENVLERAVVIAEGPVITVEELPPDLLAAVAPHGFAAPDPDGGDEANGYHPDAAFPFLSLTENVRAERERREREQFVRALAAAGGNKAEAARALNLARSTFVSRLKRLGLS